MNEAPINSLKTRPLIRYAIVGLVAAPFLVVGGCYAIFTGQALIEGGFTPKRVYFFTSPDSRSTLVITKRIAFPAAEMVDPSIIVRIELRDAPSGRVLDRRRLRLEEDGDLREPKIDWTSDSVQVREIDSRYERTLTLNRHA